jgi:hypothetical protein
VTTSAPARPRDWPELAEWWSAQELPHWNRDILAGRMPASALVGEVNLLLATLPEPDVLPPSQACRLLIHLGLWGSSVARHRQERDRALTSTPEASLEPLRAGAQRTRFREYVAAVAARTRTGHPPRDSYASLVRWNVPTVEVWWQGARLERLEGMRADHPVCTYTGDPGERRFLVLLKRAEALERAANELLVPLAEEQVALGRPEAHERMRIATALLYAVHEVNRAFIRRTEDALTADHFIDVLRQFAVHWERGDVPPSGAQDPEFLRRDLLLGLDFPDHPAHVRRVFPALLARERLELERMMDAEPLAHLVLRRSGLDAGALERLPAPRLADAVARRPALGYAYRLLRANAQVAASHLMLVKRFLFNPMRARDRADDAVVPNSAGTTGMPEPLLERLAQARRRHPLAALRRVPLDDLLGPQPIGDLAAVVRSRAAIPAGDE